MQKIIILFIIGFSITLFLLYLQSSPNLTILSPLSKQYWDMQSIDTMKYSRDTAREKLKDPTFDLVIDKQMADIAGTGANYVAIGTPYDEEFYPILKRWVTYARKYHLHVWFRGNFSGWEGWFGYSKITPEMHTAKVQEFIVNNKDLFQDGDIFTSCPECENGIHLQYGDPQSLSQYREFLITEYRSTKKLFFQIGKNVKSNYYSMNGDVAKALMDKQTTTELDGIVVIDHYVATPEQYVSDIQTIAEKSGGEIILGEFGAPIPDIQGAMTESQQAQWINDVMQKLTQIPQVKGVNYWVNTGGSTEIWTGDGKPRSAVAILQKYYSYRKLF